MQALPPPENVILERPSEHTSKRADGTTYKLEYTPGIFAPAMPSGRTVSQRSGFHSPASSPQRALFRLEENRPTQTGVPLGTGISRTMVPSSP